MLLSIDIFAPSPDHISVLSLVDRQGGVEVDRPGILLGVVVDDGVEVIDERGVVDREEVFEFEGEEVKVVGKVGDVGESPGVHFLLFLDYIANESI